MNSGRCHGCGESERRRFSQFCVPCSGANRLFSRFGSGREIAASAVASAKAAGELLSPSKFICADCDERAACYDHRDYNKPLVVSPVCKGCNVRRGSAAPRDWTFEEFMQWAQARPHVVSAIDSLPRLAVSRLAERHFAGSIKPASPARKAPQRQTKAPA